MFTGYKRTLEEKGEVYIRVKARPGAGKTCAKGIMAGADGETLKFDIAAAPEKGKANRELARFFSTEFSVPRDNVKILAGAGDKIKLVKITG